MPQQRQNLPHKACAQPSPNLRRQLISSKRSEQRTLDRPRPAGTAPSTLPTFTAAAHESLLVRIPRATAATATRAVRCHGGHRRGTMNAGRIQPSGLLEHGPLRRAVRRGDDAEQLRRQPLQ